MLCFFMFERRGREFSIVHYLFLRLFAKGPQVTYLNPVSNTEPCETLCDLDQVCCNVHYQDGLFYVVK